MLVLLAWKSSLGKESSVQESRETVGMINSNEYWLICTYSQGELQLQPTLTDKKVSVNYISWYFQFLCREYGKAERLPEDSFLLFFTCGLEFTKADYKNTSS